MIIIVILLLISSIILALIGIKQMTDAKAMVDTKQENLQKEQEEKRNLQIEINTLTQNREQLKHSINQLNNDRINFIKEQEEEYKNQKERIDEQVSLYKQNMDHAKSAYIDNIEKEYSRTEDSYKRKKQELQNKQEQIEKDIKDAGSRFEALKSQINAATEAQLREREKEEQLNFYKLNVTDDELEDIKILESIKPTLKQPIILSKLIWSTYFQKQTNELCARVCGTTPITGIYKITNIITKQCYVGQSVNIQDRWKQHIKCGLSIEASPTNKLYKAMMKDGVWNFTFEVLEECPRERLNEVEKKWIEIYKASELGYNTTSGNK